MPQTNRNISLTPNAETTLSALSAAVQETVTSGKLTESKIFRFALHYAWRAIREAPNQHEAAFDFFVHGTAADSVVVRQPTDEDLAGLGVKKKARKEKELVHA